MIIIFVSRFRIFFQLQLLYQAKQNRLNEDIIVMVVVKNISFSLVAFLEWIYIDIFQVMKQRKDNNNVVSNKSVNLLQLWMYV